MVRQELPLERVPHAHIRRTVPQPGEVEPDVLAPHHRLEGLPNRWLLEQPAGEEFDSIEIQCEAFQHSLAGEAVVITATENERVPNVFRAPSVLLQADQPEDVSIMAA